MKAIITGLMVHFTIESEVKFSPQESKIVHMLPELKENVTAIQKKGGRKQKNRYAV